MWCPARLCGLVWQHEMACRPRHAEHACYKSLEDEQAELGGRVVGSRGRRTRFGSRRGGSCGGLTTAQTSRAAGGLSTSSASGIAASIVQDVSSLAAATYQVGFQLASPQQASCVQPRLSTVSSNAVV